MSSTRCCTAVVQVLTVLDEDFGKGKLRDGYESGVGPGFDTAAESTGPVQCVEEPYHDIATDGFFDSLEAGASSKEFFKSSER